MDSSRPRRSQRRRAQNSDDNSRQVRQARPTAPNNPIAGPSTASQNIPDKENDNSEEIHEDDLCPICRLLLCPPVTTRCNHTLCESCMAHWADVSVTSQMTIVDVDEEPVAFNPVSGVEAKCPMCRTQTSAVRDEERGRILAGKYPRTWGERKEEEQRDEDEGAAIQTITVYIGNRHRLVRAEDANTHEWTFFVKPSRVDIIEEVQIQLHPTFRPSLIIRQREPYSIQRLGWGVFTITAYVILKAGYTWVSSDAQNTPDGAPKGMLPLEWNLDFEGFGGKGSMGRCRLKVKNDREVWMDEDREDEREWRRTVRQYERDGRYEED